MSQEKVDEYKEEKKNRKKLMKQEKFQQHLILGITLACLAALIVWFCMALYGNAQQKASENSAAVTTDLDLSQIEAYQQTLNDYDSSTSSSSSADSTASDSTESVAASSASAESAVVSSSAQ